MATSITHTRRSGFLSQAGLGKLGKLVFAAAALTCSTTAAQAQTTPPPDTVTIYGKVYNDRNGLTDSIINGVPINMTTSGSGQLYVYLLNNLDQIVGSANVFETNGQFSLEAPEGRPFSLSLGKADSTLGLALQLFAATAEGENPLGDGTPDFSAPIVVTDSMVVNFGIDRRPIGYPYTLQVNNFSQYERVGGKKLIIIPDTAFTGEDYEDGIYAKGMAGRSIDLLRAFNGNLYYNGSLVVAASASNTTRIDNFNPTLVRFEALDGSTSGSFSYNLVDDAGINEFAPNLVTVNPIALPVELTKFDGRRESGVNMLDWTTASERTNKGFYIERSLDGETFTEVGFVASKSPYGSSHTMNNYSFSDKLDAPANTPVCFYRLRQTDADGAVTYSKIVVVSFRANSTKAPAPVALYPNPTSGQLTLDWNAGAGNYGVAIRNTTGAVVLRQEVAGTEGKLHTTLDLSTLAPGQYYVLLRADNLQYGYKISVVR